MVGSCSPPLSLSPSLPLCAATPISPFLEPLTDLICVCLSGCVQSEVELHVKKIFIVSPSRGTLAFQIVDASRPMVGDAGDGVARVGKDNRLNNRVLDLRTPANQAIRRVYSGIQRAVCEFLDGKDFVKINTPKIIGGASEGGAEVFKFKYMQGTTYE